jgi:hypothetical protein
VVIVPDWALADVVAVQHPLAGIVRVKVDFENLGWNTVDMFANWSRTS